MAANRYYSATAVRTTLVTSVSNTATVLSVGSVSGFPSSTPFTLILDPGQLTEEVVTVNSMGGTTLNVSRGQDGTSTSPHDVGAVVMHGLSARDLREPQEHMAATSAVHGLTGHPVGDTDNQTITNKVMSGLANTFTNIQKSSLPVDVVYLATSQTLTGKSISGATNTFTAIPKTALPASVVYLDDTQTLTNKTLTAPVITGAALDGATNTFTNVPATTALTGVVPKANLPTDTVYDTDTGWVTAGFTMTTGMSNAGMRYRTRNGVGQVDVRLQSSSLTVNAGTDGTMSDTTLATVPSACRPASGTIYVSGSYSSGGRGYQCALALGTGGAIILQCGAPNKDLVPTSVVQSTFTFLLG